MTPEKSCGAVVFTREDGDIKYVIVESKTGCFGFPKGHTEKGEFEVETALREIFEETGLEVKLIDGFRKETSYTFEFNGRKVLKNVVYFLAEYSGGMLKAQENELNGVYLMEYDKAISVLQFDDIKKTLNEARKFINTNIL